MPTPKRADLERVILRARRNQLLWDRTSLVRLDTILHSAYRDIAGRLARVAGTGKLEEHHLQQLLSEFGQSINKLRDSHGELLQASTLKSAQNAADSAKAIAQLELSGNEYDAAVRGLLPEQTRTFGVGSGVGNVTVRFGLIAENAVEAIYTRVLSDGLTLSDRLWRLDSANRLAIENKVVTAVAQGKSARALAVDLREHLTSAGTANMRYNSMRLARTEISHAHREGSIRSYVDNDTGELLPHLSAIGWRLSMSHPAVDICCRKGTLVTTNRGDKRIENVAVGDLVLTHKGQYAPVTRLYRNTIPAGLLVRLRYQAEKNHTREVVVTPNHPVLTAQGWIPAGDLKTGCPGVFLEKDCIFTTGEVVFNLGVAEDNSYFANGLAVHNCDDWASDDSAGLGPGNYLPADVPVDHPNGLCFTVPILVNHPEMQFVSKEPEPVSKTEKPLRDIAKQKEIESGTPTKIERDQSKSEKPIIDTLHPADMPEGAREALSQFEVISKSPYSDSFYDITNKSWNDNPAGSLRLSDHWNFESLGTMHEITDIIPPKNSWTLAKLEKGVYRVQGSWPKITDEIVKEQNRLTKDIAVFNRSTLAEKHLQVLREVLNNGQVILNVEDNAQMRLMATGALNPIDREGRSILVVRDGMLPSIMEKLK